MRRNFACTTDEVPRTTDEVPRTTDEVPRTTDEVLATVEFYVDPGTENCVSRRHLTPYTRQRGRYEREPETAERLSYTPLSTAKHSSRTFLCVILAVLVHCVRARRFCCVIQRIKQPTKCTERASTTASFHNVESRSLIFVDFSSRFPFCFSRASLPFLLLSSLPYSEPWSMAVMAGGNGVFVALAWMAMKVTDEQRNHVHQNQRMRRRVFE